MRFVVLRYRPEPDGAGAVTDGALLDELTGGGRAGERAAPSSHAAAVPGATPWSDPTPPDDLTVAAALAGIVAGPRTPRDDLAALAAVLGVTTVLDETLGSPDAATTVRSRAQGVTLTDGTAGERLVGLHVLDAPDLDALVDVLTLLPAGTFEVHPVVAA